MESRSGYLKICGHCASLKNITWPTEANMWESGSAPDHDARFSSAIVAKQSATMALKAFWTQEATSSHIDDQENIASVFAVKRRVEKNLSIYMTKSETSKWVGALRIIRNGASSPQSASFNYKHWDVHSSRCSQ
jgi:hypothetical protein